MSEIQDKIKKTKELLTVKFPDMIKLLKNDQVLLIANALNEKGLSIEANDFYITPSKKDKIGNYTECKVIFSIEFFRKIAKRTANYGLLIKAVHSDGFVADLPLEGKKLIGAKAILTLKGEKSEKSVLLDEYDTGKNLWESKPFVMISKVAEASILRMCFPETFQGMYIAEEFHQNNSMIETKAQVVSEKTSRLEGTDLKRKEELELKKKKREITDYLKEQGFNEASITDFLANTKKQMNITTESISSLDEAQKIYEYCIDFCEKKDAKEVDWEKVESDVKKEEALFETSIDGGYGND
jgi:hypothetical protein